MRPPPRSTTCYSGSWPLTSPPRGRRPTLQREPCSTADDTNTREGNQRMTLTKRSVAITATGETPMTAKGQGKTNLQLMAEASKQAIESVGLPREEIGGV